MKKSALRDPEDPVIQGRETSVTREDVLLTAENPWPGLVSFSETNQAFFFGRDREIADLARMVAQETLTVLFGKSGLGKSSILNAGLAPVLRKSEFVPIYIRLDYSEDAPALADQIKARIEETLDAEKIDAPRPGPAESLWEYFHTKGRDWWDHDNRLVKPVLICDQFEELLTIGQDTPARTARTHEFLTQLEDLIDNRIPASLQKRLEAERGLAKDYDLDHVAYRIVLSLREDFLADLESLHDRLRPVMRNRFRLLPMSGEQAMDVILKPGARLVDEDVAVRIVDFVSSSERSRLRKALTRKEISGRQVEPALLSVVLRELNNRRCHSGRDKITADLVGEGQAAEILQAFYERGLCDMDERVGEFVVDYLLTSSGARNRVAEEDAIARPGITPQVIAKLIDRRIIQRQSSGNVKWLELSHDTLADVVRANRAEYRQRREVAAAAARAAEAHRNLMRSRRLVAAFASLALLAGIGLVWAIFSTVKANRSAETANQMNLRLAESNRKFAEQQTQLEGTNKRLEQQGLALKQAAEALKERDDKFRSDAEEQADKILTSFRQELADLKPDAGPRVLAELEHLADYASHFDSVRSRYALGKALGAELLYSYGYVRQGLDAAKAAVQLAQGLPNGGRANEEPRVIRAAASYALGRGEMEEGRLDKAEDHLREAIGLLKSPPTSVIKTIQADAARIHALAQMAIGDVNFNRYSMKEAREAYQQLLASLDRNSQSSDAVIIYCKARTLQQLARTDTQYQTARTNYEKADALVRDMKKQHPENVWWLTQFALLAQRHSGALMDASRSSAAARLLREAEPIADNVHKLDPKNLFTAYVFASVDLGLGRFYQTSGNSSEAGRLLQNTIDVTDRINREQPSWVANRYLNGASRYYSADAAEEKDKEKKYSESRAILETLAGDAPEYAEYLRSAVFPNVQLAILRSAAKDYAGAIENYRRALALIDRIPTKTRADFRFQDTLAYVNTSLGYYGYLPLDRRQDARRAYQEAILIYREATKASPTPSTYDSLANARRWLGDSYLQEGAYGSAAAAYQESIAAYDEGLSKFAKNPELLGQLFEQKGNMALYFAQQWRQKNQFQAATAALKVAAETARAGLTADPLQSSLYDLFTKVGKEGGDLKAAVSQVATDAKRSEGAGNPEQLTKELDSTIKIATANTILLPEGAKISSANILEVGRSQPWEVPPLIPGGWLPLSKDEEQEERQHLPSGSVWQKRIKPNDVIRIRKLPLTFYDSAFLYEAEVKRAGKNPGVLNYVRSARETMVLDGKFATIRDFNKKELLRLETAEQAAQYLRFFLSGRANDEGSTIRVIDSVMDLPFPPAVAASDREKLARIIIPLEVRQTADGKWDAKATVQYQNSLNYAVLHINYLGSPSNDVGMSGAIQVAGDQPLLTEQFVRGLRIMSDYAYRKGLIREAVKRDDVAKQWTAAVKSQGDLIRLVRRNELGTAAARAKELSSELFLLSVYQMFAKDFVGALSSADEGLKLEPTSIPLEAMRAHALLFLGRTQEADDIYHKHLGEKTQPVWDQLILTQLRTLEATGISHPDFARVREMMGYPFRKADLKAAVSRLSKAKNWLEAVRLQRELVALVQGNAAERAADLPDDLLGLAWYQLHTKDFSGALASSEEGLKLDPAKIVLDTNRAHALLFLGRTQEAEDVYRKHLGEKTSQGPWEKVILDDLKVLEEDGLSYPGFARIREMMGAQK